jgi:hypothetical protein
MPLDTFVICTCAIFKALIYTDHEKIGHTWGSKVKNVTGGSFKKANAEAEKTPKCEREETGKINSNVDKQLMVT